MHESNTLKHKHISRLLQEEVREIHIFWLRVDTDLRSAF